MVTEKPKFSEAYNNLGLVYMQLKNIQKAKKNFEKSIKYKTNFSDPYNNLGILFRNQNNISSNLKLQTFPFEPPHRFVFPPFCAVCILFFGRFILCMFCIES